jgi:nitrogen fixation/metabolism regulation signal transduction histidine kinase
VLDGLQADLLAKARSGPGPGRRRTAVPSRLNRLREQAGAQTAILITLSGQVLASSRPSWAALLPPLPAPSQLRQARGGRGLATSAMRRRRRADGARAGAGGRQRVSVASRSPATDQPVPPSIAKSAESVETAHRDYQELQLGRGGLKQIYTLTLTLAPAAGPVRRDRPGLLPRRAPGAAAADPRRRHPGGGRRRLHAARHGRGLRRTRRADPFLQQHDPAAGRGATQAEHHRAETEAAQAYLESVLANLSAGVLAFDLRFRLRAANRGALAILGDDLAGFEQMRCRTGRATRPWPAPSSRALRGAGGEWQQQLELARPDGMPQALLVRGTALPARAAAAATWWCSTTSRN